MEMEMLVTQVADLGRGVIVNIIRRHDGAGKMDQGRGRIGLGKNQAGQDEDRSEGPPK
jgi:hypothetical protein